MKKKSDTKERKKNDNDNELKERTNVQRNLNIIINEKEKKIEWMFIRNHVILRQTHNYWLSIFFGWFFPSSSSSSSSVHRSIFDMNRIEWSYEWMTEYDSGKKQIFFFFLHHQDSLMFDDDEYLRSNQKKNPEMLIFSHYISPLVPKKKCHQYQKKGSGQSSFRTKTLHDSFFSTYNPFVPCLNPFIPKNDDDDEKKRTKFTSLIQ